MPISKFVAILILATCAHADTRAQALLHEVVDRYRTLKSGRIESIREAEIVSEMHHSWQKYVTTIAFSLPGKVHFEEHGDVGWFIVVSDGKTLWRATPYTRESMRTPIEGSVLDVKGGGSEGEMAIRALKFYFQQYDRIVNDILAASIIGEEQIEVGGVPIPCTVVRVDYKPPASTGITSWTRTFWIDNARKLILRDESLTRGAHRMDAPFNLSDLRNVTRVTLASLDEPLPDSLFAYTSPPNFTMVEKLNRFESRRPVELIGRPAPELTLNLLDGVSLNLSSLHGKTVLLDFWATWCPPCREQMPFIAKLYAETKDQGLAILGVDDDESPEIGAAFLQQQHYRWPSLFDGKDHTAREKYKVRGIPSMVLINKEGIISDVQLGSGPESENGVRAALQKLGFSFSR